MLGNLLLDARSNFTLLDTLYFCISIKILELCSGSKINYLEAVLKLLIFYGLLGETRPSSIQLIISPYWGKILLCTLANALWIWKFSCLVGTVPSWLWAPGTPLILSDGFFPFLGSFSFTYALSRTHANNYRNPLQTLEFNLCVTFVSQVSILLTLAIWAPHTLTSMSSTKGEVIDRYVGFCLTAGRWHF